MDRGGIDRIQRILFKQNEHRRTLLFLATSHRYPAARPASGHQSSSHFTFLFSVSPCSNCFWNWLIVFIDDIVCLHTHNKEHVYPRTNCSHIKLEKIMIFNRWQQQTGSINFAFFYCTKRKGTRTNTQCSPSYWVRGECQLFNMVWFIPCSLRHNIVYSCSLVVRGVRGERGEVGVEEPEENSACCCWSASKLHTRTMLSPWPDTSNSWENCRQRTQPPPKK